MSEWRGGPDRQWIDRGGGRIDVRLSTNAEPDFERWEDGDGAWLKFHDDQVVVRLAIEGDPDARCSFWSRLEQTGADAADEDWPDDDGEEVW
jgi:hypothetical protein